MSPYSSSNPWLHVAARMVEDVGVRAGELVLVRDRIGDLALLAEVLLAVAVEERGGTPLPEVMTSAYVNRLLAGTDPARLSDWDTRRQDWVRAADRIIKLTDGTGDLSGASTGALEAWGQAVTRLSEIEDERRIPSVLVAIPTADQAGRLGMTVSELEEVVLPALVTPVGELSGQLEGVLRHALGGSRLTVLTGEGCTLHLRRDGRPCHVDDGIIDNSDLDGGHVVNLPAGALYTTVIEDAVDGDLWLERAGPARDVRLHFESGRVTGIEAAEGAVGLSALFDGESGESRRISHVGIGFNRRLRRPIGWELVDEHIHGALIVAFGENRYLGGRNASSLNVDFCSLQATVYADRQMVVDRGAIPESRA